MSRPVCVLVGPPGAGKTTVGRMVADALGVEFRDSDADIVTMTGKPIPDIFVDDGEAHFRELEAAAVAGALTGFRGVLAVGGGAVLSDATRERLREHVVVYLSVDLTDAIKRVGLGSGRPLLTVNPRATLRFLLDRRRPLYEEVATYTVPTEGLDPGGVLAAVLVVLGSGGCDA